MTTEPKKVKLIFSKPVADMLTQARVFHQNITTDQAALTAVDPSITDAWNIQFNTDIDNAEAMPQPASAIAQRTTVKEELDDLMEQAREAVQEAYYYVGNTFPDSRAHLNTYGKQDYEHARKNQDKLGRLMALMQDQMTVDTTALNGVGYTAAKINAFGTLYAALMAKNTDHSQKMDGDQLVTEAYYNAMNDIWEKMSKVNRAAMLAFANDAAKRQQYLLYDGAPSDYAFTMHVPAAPGAVYHEFLAPLRQNQQIFVKLLTNPTANITVCFATGNAAPCGGPTQVVTGTTEAHFMRSQFFAGTSRFLRLTSDSPSETSVRITLPE